jgi:hypothetical protein
VSVRNCTTEDNGAGGISTIDLRGSLTIEACLVQTNRADGVVVGPLFEPGHTYEVKGSIVCGNDGDGLSLESDILVDAEGNWWGCPEGPTNTGCDSVTELAGTIDYTPWVDTISANAVPDSPMVGEPTAIRFQFSGGPPATYLGKGPGNLHGDPTFEVTTDNGTVTSSGFIGDSEGTLEMTLTPAHSGTARVWVDGPCGLDETIVLGVEAEFVPEPGSVMLLASGLMGLAGYARLRLRRR